MGWTKYQSRHELLKTDTDSKKCCFCSAVLYHFMIKQTVKHKTVNVIF